MHWPLNRAYRKNRIQDDRAGGCFGLPAQRQAVQITRFDLDRFIEAWGNVLRVPKPPTGNAPINAQCQAHPVAASDADNIAQPWWNGRNAFLIPAPGRDRAVGLNCQAM